MNKDKRLAARFIAAFALARLLHMLILGGPTSGMLPPSAEILVAGIAMFGALGLLQGLSLMAYGFRRTLALGACSAVAGGIVFGLAYLDALAPLAAIPALAGYGLFTGATLGAMQLIVLWPMLSRRALWLLLIALAWAMGYAVQYALIWLMIDSGTLAESTAIFAAADVLASMVIGGITGIAFILLHGDTDERARRADETGQEHRS